VGKTAEPRVIVVGAAVAGSAVANAMGSQGIPTLVLEKGAERDNSTRGDILHPPTLKFLEAWGVLPDLHADGALPMTTIAVSSLDRGLIAAFAVSPVGEGPASRSIAVPHDRIEAVMKRAAERWPSVTSIRASVTALIREGGRVVGVKARTAEGEQEFRADLIVGCDGSQSLVRRELGIGVDRHPYDHEFLYIAAEGPTDPPAAMHFHLDPQGVIMTASRPGNRLRIAISFNVGTRGDLLRRPDPYLHDYVVSRFPELANTKFGKANAHLYPLVKQLADAFSSPGVALVGDAAHTTHPAGATGMNLAISGAARLAEMVSPLLQGAPDPAAIDAALEAYAAERRPAAATAIQQNHEQAMRIWQDGVQHDPDAYVRAIDPNARWGAGGAGWGKDPAALNKQ
jgi:2-polyprenyl-6-methoxyphenol hydroxylase-like FAD-dependent oxidoreductase